MAAVASCRPCYRRLHQGRLAALRIQCQDRSRSASQRCASSAKIAQGTTCSRVGLDWLLALGRVEPCSSTRCRWPPLKSLMSAFGPWLHWEGAWGQEHAAQLQKIIIERGRSQECIDASGEQAPAQREARSVAPAQREAVQLGGGFQPGPPRVGLHWLLAGPRLALLSTQLN